MFVTRAHPVGYFTLDEAIDLLEPAYAARRPRTGASALSEAEIAAWLDYYACFFLRQAQLLLEQADAVVARIAAKRARTP